MNDWHCGASSGEDGTGRDDGAVRIFRIRLLWFPTLCQKKTARMGGRLFSQQSAPVARISGMQIITDVRRWFRQSGSHSL
jgi:hypothetical protein